MPRRSSPIRDRTGDPISTIISKTDNPVAVGPGDFLKNRRRRQRLQRRERFARNTPRADAGPRRAAAIAAEHQLVLMPLEKTGGELRIAFEKVVAGVR